MSGLEELRAELGRQYLSARPGSPNDRFRRQMDAALDRLEAAEAAVARVRSLADLYDAAGCARTPRPPWHHLATEVRNAAALAQPDAVREGAGS